MLHRCASFSSLISLTYLKTQLRNDLLSFPDSSFSISFFFSQNYLFWKGDWKFKSYDLNSWARIRKKGIIPWVCERFQNLKRGNPQIFVITVRYCMEWGPLPGTGIHIQVLGWCRSQLAMFTRPGLGRHLPSEPCYVEEMPFISIICLVLQ